MRGQPDKTAVDQNVGNPSFLDTAEHLDGPVRRGDQQHVDTARDELFDGLAFRALDPARRK